MWTRIRCVQKHSGTCKLTWLWRSTLHVWVGILIRCWALWSRWRFHVRWIKWAWLLLLLLLLWRSLSGIRRRNWRRRSKSSRLCTFSITTTSLGWLGRLYHGWHVVRISVWASGRDRLSINMIWSAWVWNDIVCRWIGIILLRTGRWRRSLRWRTCWKRRVRDSSTMRAIGIVTKLLVLPLFSHSQAANKHMVRVMSHGIMCTWL